MEDRQSLKPGRVKIMLDDGSVMYGTIERADEPVVTGTPLNKNTFFTNSNEERFACQLPSEAFSLLTNEIVITVPASGWSSSKDADGYYSNQVAVTGMKEKYTPIYSVVQTDADSALEIENAFSEIKRLFTHDGYVIFKSAKQIEIDINIKLKGV